LSRSSSRPSVSARVRLAMSAAAVVNRDAVTVLDGLQTDPTAKWVSPTPGGPRMTTFSPCSMKWQVLSVWICFLSIDGW